MTEPWKRKEVIGDCTLYLGDCLEIMPTLGKVGHVISDPPYESITQDKWGVLNSVKYRDFDDSGLKFKSIDEIRKPISRAVAAASQGWVILFCQAEGVRAWRDDFAKTPAKYKRAMVWVKPDAMPQFNGQGPSMGFENMIAVWCGSGHSKWNGRGRPGVLTHCKNSGGKHQHKTQKPIPLMLELVSLFSNHSETILDPFMGSGTTGVACVKLGRKFIGIEIDEDYFNISCERIEDAVSRPDLFISAPGLQPKQEAML